MVCVSVKLNIISLDEEDQFFSDFASTDDEAAEEEGGKDSQTCEAAIQDEERAEKKVR
jgi:hypothetical protein